MIYLLFHVVISFVSVFIFDDVLFTDSFQS